LSIPDTLALKRASRVAAWAVHGYTAIGTVLAFAMVIAAMEGRTTTALSLFLVAMVVDGTDGLLARKLRVKEAVPWFDGALLDNIVDYLTYCFAPIVLLWADGHLPSGILGGAIACLPLLASSFQFCRTDAKTADHFFMGFPSYWNVLAFYAIVLGLAPTTTGTLVVILTGLVFVPVKYVYPSRTTTLWHTNMAATAAWLVVYAVIVAQLPDPNPWVVALSLAYIAGYAAESLFLTLRQRPTTVAETHVPELSPR
jgi:phosphatidylcholine synthase